MNNIFKDTKQFTFMSMMFALTILFVYTVGMLPTGLASLAVLTFVPCILTGIVYGPVSGAIMGLLTGLVTLTRALTMPTSILDPLFINPLVSVLPRIFVGVTPYYAYKFFQKIFKEKNSTIFISSGLAGALGAITNTALVMGMLYVVYASKIVAMVGASFKVFLISVISSSAVIEAISTFILVSAVTTIYYKTKRG